MANESKIGRYEVVCVLGRGAMGTVYKAIDPLIERTVAIKTVSLDLSRTERAEFEERFFREARSAGRLSHPNIVTIYDVGETNDVAYIAMEFLEGESLRELLDSGVVLPLTHISRIAKRIASALDYAHANHVVHRDIKPGNIMIARNRDIKIMDFGIAKIASDSRTIDGTVLGSPKYMAPEQIVGDLTDGRADIFALGALLYEMLTGRAPFSGDNLNAIMYKIVNEDPVPPSRMTPRVPVEFDGIIARALAKRPEDRYQTARQLANDLRRCERSAPPESRKVIRQRPPSSRPTTALVHAQETTVVLAPRGPAAGAAVYRRLAALDIRGAALRLRRLPVRANYVLFAIPVLATIAFAIFLQMNPPYGQAPSRSAVPIAADRVDRSSPVRTAAVAPSITVAPAAAISPAVSGNAHSAAAPSMTVAVPVARERTSEPAIKPMAALSPVAAAHAPVAANPPAERTKRNHATVNLAVAPWGKIYLDGRSVGLSPPLKHLKLPPGNHTLEIRNAEFPAVRRTVNLASGASFDFRHTFQ